MLEYDRNRYAKNGGATTMVKKDKGQKKLTVEQLKDMKNRAKSSGPSKYGKEILRK